MSLLCVFTVCRIVGWLCVCLVVVVFVCVVCCWFVGGLFVRMVDRCVRWVLCVGWVVGCLIMCLIVGLVHVVMCSSDGWLVPSHLGCCVRLCCCVLVGGLYIWLIDVCVCSFCGLFVSRLAIRPFVHSCV